MLNAGIVRVYVNPVQGSKPIVPGGYVTRVEIEFLAAGTIPTRIGDRYVEINVPAIKIEAPSQPLPKNIRDALIAQAAQVPEVSELAYCDASVQGGPSQRTIAVGFEKTTSKDSFRSVITDLIGSVQAMLPPRETLDFVALPTLPASEARKAQSIYKRP
jgi:hypothetical protein